MNFTPADIRILVRVITRRTGTPVHDEDLIQDASLRVVEAFHNRDDIRHPRAFLKKVVQNTISDHWRKRRLEVKLGGVEIEGYDTPSLEDDLDRRRQLHLLRRALARLDDGKRATIDLFYIQDRTVAEIARLQGKSVSAVKMDLLRSRRRLLGIVRSLAKRSSRSPE
ncbi:MAG TPA: sigma-70 family RNA polymerase sigma factor [Terriglobia bacterium]|nr:sigma-70 family RNA polymerase sigma factor [Terriglobia bacterium]